VRLFPVTFEQPQTAFIFTAMKQFRVHSLASKKSTYDYVRALCQLSNNAVPDTIAISGTSFLSHSRLNLYTIRTVIENSYSARVASGGT
jgi:hypothetical protein